MAQKRTSGNDPLETRPQVRRLAWLRSIRNRHLRFLPWLLGFYFFWLGWYLLTTFSPGISATGQLAIAVQVMMTAGMWGGIGLIWFAMYAAQRELKGTLTANGHRLCPHCGFTPGEIVLPAPCPECGHALAANIEEQWRAYETRRKTLLGRKSIEEIFREP